MKKFTQTIAFTFLLLGCLSAQRYLSPVFTDLVKTGENVIYGVNATVLTVSGPTRQAEPQPLTCDVYEPAGDTEDERPLIILLHTGNFLPPQINGGCGGAKNDPVLVDLAGRLVKLGYVVAIANYRLGWNPIASTQTERVYTLINAAYRGVQDASTIIRFFRKSHQELGNPYGIDPDRIALWGNGTGGYISFAAATLDTITDTYIPKFSTAQGPMVFEPVNGDLYGTKVGVTFPGYPGFPAGDTLCYPNHIGYSSAFKLAVNMGGALGDTSWIDENDPPVISYHVPTDPYAPCDIGIVNVPPPHNLPVVEVAGSCFAQQIFNRKGNNACMVSANIRDGLGQIARSRNGNNEGFYPFPVEDVTVSSPWTYYNSLEPYGIAGSNCDTFKTVASAYLDTIVQYFIPRGYACLMLATANQEIYDAAEVGLNMSPNPAIDFVNFETKSEFPVEDVAVYDMSGKYLTGSFGLNANSFTIRRGNLPPGLYFVKLRFKEGIITQKLIFN